MDRAAFLERFPEFERAPSAMVDDAIAVAVATTPEGIDPVLASRIVGLRAAHSLSASPYGRTLRKTGDAESVYQAELAPLLSAIGLGAFCL